LLQSCYLSGFMVPAPEIRSRPYGIIVPAYQASSTLAGVISGLVPFASRADIVVVDDGSTDGTARVGEALGATVLRHPANRGKGAALMTGLLHARDALGWEWALTVDADGQHHAEDLEGFLSMRPHEKTGVVVGARARAGTAMPWHRRFSNSTTTWLVSQLAGKPVHDAQCGYRAYRLDAVAAFAPGGRFEWEADALIRAARAGYAIEKVPVRTVYGDQGSHMDLWRDSIRFLRMAVRAARDSRDS
jgi:glycosyltransferase involved in cell wall biosynthesis